MGQPRPSLTALKAHGGGSTQTQSYCTQNTSGGSTQTQSYGSAQTQSYCTQNPWGWVNPDPVLWVNPDPVLLHSKPMGVGQPGPSNIALKTHEGGSTQTQSYCTQNTWGWVNPDPVILHSKPMGVGQPGPSLTALKAQALSVQVLVSTCKHFFHNFRTVQQTCHR